MTRRDGTVVAMECGVRSPMLFFELFPAFLAIVALVTGIWLFMMNREGDDTW